jgi:hypothetical protein
VKEKGEQNDNRNRHTDQPKQNSTAHDALLICCHNGSAYKTSNSGFRSNGKMPLSNEAARHFKTSPLAAQLINELWAASSESRGVKFSVIAIIEAALRVAGLMR